MIEKERKTERNGVFVESMKQNKVIFTEALPAVSQCARSKSASRADVLQAVDKTHPPASKRDTADSQLHNYTYNLPTQSMAT